MSTENTDNTSTTETNDSKAVFAPLGKYAIVAVIMVSVIVTTAIMLDKELNNTEKQLADSEAEATELNSADATDPNNANTSEQTAVSAIEREVKETQNATYITEQQVAKINAQSSEMAKAVNPVAAAPVQKVAQAVPASAPAAAAENTAAAASQEPVTSNEEAAVQQSPVQVQATSKPAIAENQTASKETAEQQTANRETNPLETGSLAEQRPVVNDSYELERQERLAAFRLEQKQHMSEMFTRIEAWDSERLAQYKAHQDEQIERLREQNAHQQQMIDELIVRNKELFELRAARFKRQQSDREQLLNRI